MKANPENPPKIHPIDIGETFHKQKMVIEIVDRNIQAIYSEFPVEFVCIDYDGADWCDAESGELDEFVLPSGEKERAFTNRFTSLVNAKMIKTIFKQL